MGIQSHLSIPSKSLFPRPLAVCLVVAGVLGRLIPHPANLAPVGAVSLYGGARLRGWRAYVIAPLIILATDPIMGWIYGYPPFTLVTPFVCLGFLIYVHLGRYLQNTQRPAAIAGASLLGGFQFFLITNFGIWVSGISYPMSLAGLLECYLAGIPFLGRTLIGDLIFAGILFGLHAFLAPRLAPAERVSANVVA